MKKFILLTLSLTLLTVYLFSNSRETICITKDNIDLFINVLLPNLFPYMILVLLFIKFKCHLLIAYFIQYISIPLFNISGKSFSIILIGIVGGYPLIALLAKDIIDKNNKKELNKLVPLFSYPSLAFILNIIRNNSHINFLIYYLLASLIILLIFKDQDKKEYITFSNIKSELNINNYLSIFSKALLTSLNNLGLIFSNLLFFSLFKTLFKFNNIKFNNILLGLFEFSSSSIFLSKNINNIFDIIILGIILLFGGFNIVSQMIIIYNDSLLSMKKYIKYRLLLIFIFSLLTYILI